MSVPCSGRCSGRRVGTGAPNVSAVTRPARFEHFRYLGDKRHQVVYDLDDDDPAVTERVAEVLAAETFTTFGPDTLEEARNRCYRPFRHDPED